MFAVVYEINGNIWNTQKNDYSDSFSEILHFSFTTQTTLGYGDLAPLKSAQVISAAHTTIALLINAIVFGLIILRIIRRPPSINFADVICYNKESHCLVFWFWNKDSSDFVDVTATIILRRKISLEEDPFLRYKNCIFSLSKEPPPYVNSMATIVIRTDSCENPQNPPNVDLFGLKISALSFKEDDTIRIFVTGSGVDSGANMVVKKEYNLNSIRCGEFLHILPDGIDTGNWHDRNYSQFGKYESTKIDDCRSCELSDKCQFDVAIMMRKYEQDKNKKRY